MLFEPTCLSYVSCSWWGSWDRFHKTLIKVGKSLRSSKVISRSTGRKTTGMYLAGVLSQPAVHQVSASPSIVIFLPASQRFLIFLLADQPAGMPASRVASWQFCQTHLPASRLAISPSLPASRSILAPSWELASQPANFGSQLATCQPAGKWPHNGYLA